MLKARGFVPGVIALLRWGDGSGSPHDNRGVIAAMRCSADVHSPPPVHNLFAVRRMH